MSPRLDCADHDDLSGRLTATSHQNKSFSACEHLEKCRERLWAEVQIAWPGLAKRSRAPVEQICRDIQRQQIPRMYPTYGDIYAMTVERQ